jgi:hypothetical protein
VALNLIGVQRPLYVAYRSGRSRLVTVVITTHTGHFSYCLCCQFRIIQHKHRPSSSGPRRDLSTIGAVLATATRVPIFPSPEKFNEDETQTAAALHAIFVDDRIRIAENVAENLAAAHPGLPSDPRTLNEAKRSEHHNAWCTSSDKKLSKLEDCGTFLPCDLPAGEPLLDNVTVFRTKMEADGTITERKTRININNAQQHEGLHFDPDC